jgi:hypothetical protein
MMMTANTLSPQPDTCCKSWLNCNARTRFHLGLILYEGRLYFVKMHRLFMKKPRKELSGPNLPELCMLLSNPWVNASARRVLSTCVLPKKVTTCHAHRQNASSGPTIATEQFSNVLQTCSVLRTSIHGISKPESSIMKPLIRQSWWNH